MANAIFNPLLYLSTSNTVAEHTELGLNSAPRAAQGESMRVPGAAELESRMNQEESDTTNTEQEVPEKGTGTHRFLLLTPLVLECSRAKCYRAHPYRHTTV